MTNDPYGWIFFGENPTPEEWEQYCAWWESIRVTPKEDQDNG